MKATSGRRFLTDSVVSGARSSTVSSTGMDADSKLKATLLVSDVADENLMDLFKAIASVRVFITEDFNVIVRGQSSPSLGIDLDHVYLELSRQLAVSVHAALAPTLQDRIN